MKRRIILSVLCVIMIILYGNFESYMFKISFVDSIRAFILGSNLYRFFAILIFWDIFYTQKQYISGNKLTYYKIMDMQKELIGFQMVIILLVLTIVVMTFHEEVSIIIYILSILQCVLNYVISNIILLFFNLKKVSTYVVLYLIICVFSVFLYGEVLYFPYQITIFNLHLMAVYILFFIVIVLLISIDKLTISVLIEYLKVKFNINQIRNILAIMLLFVGLKYLLAQNTSMVSLANYNEFMYTSAYVLFLILSMFKIEEQYKRSIKVMQINRLVYKIQYVTFEFIRSIINSLFLVCMTITIDYLIFIPSATQVYIFIFIGLIISQYLEKICKSEIVILMAMLFILCAYLIGGI